MYSCDNTFVKRVSWLSSRWTYKMMMHITVRIWQHMTMYTVALFTYFMDRPLLRLLFSVSKVNILHFENSSKLFYYYHTLFMKKKMKKKKKKKQRPEFHSHKEKQYFGALNNNLTCQVLLDTHTIVLDFTRTEISDCVLNNILWFRDILGPMCNITSKSDACFFFFFFFFISIAWSLSIYSSNYCWLCSGEPSGHLLGKSCALGFPLVSQFSGIYVPFPFDVMRGFSVRFGSCWKCVLPGSHLFVNYYLRRRLHDTNCRRLAVIC